jgi:hypothetical protein
MPTFERPWEYWLRMVDELRASPLPHPHEAADYLQVQLDEAPADQVIIRMSFSDEMYYRSIFAASLAIGDKRAIIAVGHSRLTMISHVHHDGTTYADLGAAYFDRLAPIATPATTCGASRTSASASLSQWRPPDHGPGRRSSEILHARASGPSIRSLRADRRAGP